MCRRPSTTAPLLYRIDPRIFSTVVPLLAGAVLAAVLAAALAAALELGCDRATELARAAAGAASTLAEAPQPLAANVRAASTPAVTDRCAARDAGEVDVMRAP